VRSGGLDFYAAEAIQPPNQSSRNVLATWGYDPSDPANINRPLNVGTSTTLFATVLGEEINVYAAGSNALFGPYGTFGLYSIDVGHLYSSAWAPFTMAQFDLTFFGLLRSGTTVSQTFTIPAAPTIGSFRYPVLNTLVFNTNFYADLTNVWWNQGSGSGTAHQFTNVVQVVIPEPGTYLLMLTGLSGLALVARLRRHTER
jgi:hypothetical protein